MLIKGAVRIVEKTNPVIYIALSLKSNSSKYLRLIKEFYRYNSSYGAIRLEESSGPDIIEEWERAKQEDGTYKFLAMLDASKVKTFNEAVERFDIVNVTAFEEDNNGFLNEDIFIRNIPDIIRNYSAYSINFLDYEW